MPHTFPFDLTTIVGPPAPPMFCSMAIGKTSKLGGHHRPCHGSIDPGLFDMGQCTAKRSECRIDSGSHKALKRIDDGTIIAYGFVAQLKRRVSYPYPRRTYAIATVSGVPSWVNRLSKAART